MGWFRRHFERLMTCPACRSITGVSFEERDHPKDRDLPQSERRRIYRIRCTLCNLHTNWYIDKTRAMNEWRSMK